MSWRNAHKATGAPAREIHAVLVRSCDFAYCNRGRDIMASIRPLTGVIAASVFLWLLSAVYSIIAEVPINNQIASMAKGAHLPIGSRCAEMGSALLLARGTPHDDLVFLIVGVISK
jgi:hypothetical protein